MIRTYAYQLKPTKTQVHWLFDILERLRDLQNSVRNGRMAAYEAEGITLSYADQGKELTRAPAIPTTKPCLRTFRTMCFAVLTRRSRISFAASRM